MLRERARKLLAHGAQSRVRRVERHAQSLCDFRDRHLFEQREHEDVALLVVELRDETRDELRGFMILCAFVRARGWTRRVSLEVHHAPVPPLSAALVERDVPHDAVKPRPQTGIASKIGQAAVDRDEHVLGCVVEPAFGDAEAAKRRIDV